MQNSIKPRSRHSFDMQKLMKTAAVLGVFLLIGILYVFFSQGWFKDPAKIQTMLKQTGFWGPFIFIIFQAIQVIVPILPGGFSGALGMVVFGNFLGYLYSYIGIIIGSSAAFLLVRHYGKPFVQKVMKPSAYEKYSAWLEKGKNFDRLFAVAIFAPIAPDDILCMIAGLSSISFKKFLTIIMLGKPVSLFLYSFCLVKILQALPF